MNSRVSESNVMEAKASALEATVIGIGRIDDYSSCGYVAKSVRLMI
jgi:hypothetical protein